jgi:hypothetical protein
MDMPLTQEATAVITFLNFIIFFEILQICVTALFKNGGGIGGRGGGIGGRGGGLAMIFALTSVGIHTFWTKF